MTFSLKSLLFPCVCPGRGPPTCDSSQHLFHPDRADAESPLGNQSAPAGGHVPMLESNYSHINVTELIPYSLTGQTSSSPWELALMKRTCDPSSCRYIMYQTHCNRASWWLIQEHAVASHPWNTSREKFTHFCFHENVNLFFLNPQWLTGPALTGRWNTRSRL